MHGSPLAQRQDFCRRGWWPVRGRMNAARSAVEMFLSVTRGWGDARCDDRLPPCRQAITAPRPRARNRGVRPSSWPAQPRRERRASGRAVSVGDEE